MNLTVGPPCKCRGQEGGDGGALFVHFAPADDAPPHTFAVDRQVALKFISRKFIQQNLKTADMLNWEIKCLASLKHTNILQLHERLETAEHIVLAVDLMVGGDVLQHMKGRGMLAAEVALDDEAARHMFKQVLDGVTYMHQHNVVHRDLKLDNLLLCGTAAQLVKISDFGLAQILTSPTAKVRDLNGTLEYMAPEMFHDATFMGQPLDLWALGNILFALVCGRLPFAGVPSLSTPAESWPSESVIERNIRDQVYVYESFACRGARAVCDILLSRDPSKRYLDKSIRRVYNYSGSPIQFWFIEKHETHKHGQAPRD